MKLSDGEKLIAFMLAELMEATGIESEIDPALVKSAIADGNTWALRWQYSAIFHDEEVDEQIAEEVGSILNMCSYLELSVRERIADGSLVRSNTTVFEGFDGNEEPEHYSAGSMIVTELGRFGEFAERSMNSHMPMLDKYRRMKAVYDDLPGGNAKGFSVPLLERILGA